MIGTLAEAQKIYRAVGDHLRGGIPPRGWREIGAGGTRHCYLSPSGVVYKLCYVYEDDDPTVNDREQVNFDKIRNCGKLPNNWRVPKSHLHAFRTNISRFNRRLQKEVVVPGRVAVLACEYIPGKRLGSMCKDVSGDEWWDMETAFRAVGLSDTGGANAIRATDGTHYIIDAGEEGVLIGK